jgi:hypothetical protein
MDPVSLIVGGISTIVDTIGGGPQARAEAARQNALAQAKIAEAQTAQGEQYKTIALYGVIGVVALGGIWLVAKGFGA